MLKVAPWQPLADVASIEAAPLTWTRDDPDGIVMLGLEGGVKVTPVVVQPGCPASAEIVPVPLMLYKCTENEFGLLTFRMTSAAEPPGYSVELGTSPPARADTVTVCMVPVWALPPPLPRAVKKANAVPPPENASTNAPMTSQRARAVRVDHHLRTRLSRRIATFPRCFLPGPANRRGENSLDPLNVVRGASRGPPPQLTFLNSR